MKIHDKTKVEQPDGRQHRQAENAETATGHRAAAGNAERQNQRNCAENLESPEAIMYALFQERVYEKSKRSGAPRREIDQVFSTPRLAKTVGYTLKLPNIDGGTLHLIDACAGFGMAALAAIDRIGERRRRKHVTRQGRLTVTLIEIDGSLGAAARDAVERTRTWCSHHNLELHVELVTADMLSDHNAMTEAAGGGSGSGADAVVIVPPVRTHRRDGPQNISTDRFGNARARTGSPYTEFCEAALEMLRPGGEIGAITPSSWTMSEDYETFRRRFRRVADLTEMHRFNNRGNLWGPQIVTHDTIAWRARRLEAADWVRRPRVEDPLDIMTHAARERHTHWRHTVRGSEKWIPRRRDGSSDERLNPAEDELAAKLFAWRIGQPQLTDLKLTARTGPHNDFHGPGEPKADRTRRPDGSTSKKSTAYITPWHVGRRQLNWPSPHAAGAGVPTNWVEGAPATYLTAARLKAGWYVLISTLTGSESKGHPVHVVAIGTDRFPRGHWCQDASSSPGVHRRCRAGSSSIGTRGP